ncbi:hypothetical protein [Streptomyces sp. GZWMJZ-114]|uniref:hypothetical protein n=1 Tax=Streptomyces sp. GZWMJZ-114 TaxID=2494734 RepID=UPI0013E937DD|nr:hypothetical protein [Streptomyces sp. GZWMJZ-114]
MSTTTAPSTLHAARAISDWLHPRTWIVLVSLAVGWHAQRWTGVGWSLVTVLFAAVLPMAFIDSGIRQGRWADRNVGARTGRLIVMAFILVSVAVGIALIALFHGPRDLIALTISMIVTLAVLAAITLAWKISVHQAVSAGAVIMTAQTYSPWWALAFAAVAVVGWSRVAVRDHTLAQVLVGSVVGALVAALTYASGR